MDANNQASNGPKTQIRKGGVRLLALDGGGVKGVSTLMVLGAIMTQVKNIEIERKINTSENERLPKDYFELSCGTSTGALIAIMLFRLNMSTTQTLEQYNTMATNIFSPTIFGFPLHKLGKIGDFLGKGVLMFKAVFSRAQFSDKPLRESIDTIVEKFGQDEQDQKLKGDAPLLHPKAGKMIMCSTLCDKGESILFRTYSTPEDATPVSSDAKQLVEDGEMEDITIGVACRATSAAPTYLPQVDWKKLSFWDGGLLNNNPITQLWDNRYDLVGLNEVAPTVSIVLSLGTSWSTPKPGGPFRFMNMISKVTSFMTNTEAKHRDFQRYLGRIRHRIDQNANTQYFRFNTPTDKVEIDLDEYLKMNDLKTFTTKYLAQPDVQKDIRAVAELLVGDV